MVEVVIAPSHLAGSIVTETINTEVKTFVLDRPHPFFKGQFIAVGPDYIKTVFALPGQVEAFRHQIGPCPEQADIDKAAWLLAPVIESAIVQKPIDPLVHRFTYHNDPKKDVLYDQIREWAKDMHALVDVIIGRFKDVVTHELINERCLVFAQNIDRACPNNRERAQSIDAVALARMMLNEAIVLSRDAKVGAPSAEDRSYTVAHTADRYIMIARMLACASVALD
jgi:hypothetical protein